MAKDVFISYSSHDKTIADSIYAALESKNIHCWIAPRDVPPGRSYPEALVEAIEKSSVFVLILSKDSNNSPHVLREMRIAMDKGIPVIPFQIDRAEPSKEMRYFISGIHWLDAVTPPMEKHYQRLADNVRGLLPVQAEKKSPDESSQQNSEEGQPRKGLIPRLIDRMGARLLIPLASVFGMLVLGSLLTLLMAKGIMQTPAFLRFLAPFSEKIPFTAPIDPNVLGKDLLWDAGSSEISGYSLSANAIYLTAGPHTWPNFPTIIYRQPVEGNFEAQVKFTFASSVSTLFSSAQMMGLLVRPVNDHLVVGDSSFPLNWVEATKYISDAGTMVGCRGNMVPYPSLDSVYVKIQRQNDLWKCAYSKNGQNWNWLDVHVDSESLRDRQLEIAIFAYSDTEDAITGEFSDWIITSK